MISVYLREQKRYTLNELVGIFSCASDKTAQILRRLKEYGVVKAVKANDVQLMLSDLVDEDVEISDVETEGNEYLYVFTFVGVITIEGRVLKCFPKYIRDNCAPKEELKQIIKVLEKYNSNEQIIRMLNDTSDSSTFNVLAVMLFLLQDYFEYGSYTNTQEIVEENGAGQILWDRTINETFALISQNRPYYPTLLTARRVNDDFDYYKRLHECVLTQCSKELSEADLLDLFDIIGVELSDERLDDFGEKDYILDRLQKELSIQYNTRKQRLLKTLYAFIERGKTLNDIDSFSMFGTNCFNLVWETVCAQIMDNQLRKPIGTLKLPVPLANGYNRKALLIDIIEKPIWANKTEKGEPFVKVAESTLIPDLISICYQGDNCLFIIFDAKYYNLQLEKGKPLRGQPGIESVTKQYLYQLAYKKFIENHRITQVHNCFLFPTSGNEIVDMGTTSMSMLDALGLKQIQIRMLPARKAFSMYIEDKKMDISALQL